MDNRQWFGKWSLILGLFILGLIIIFYLHLTGDLCLRAASLSTWVFGLSIACFVAAHWQMIMGKRRQWLNVTALLSSIPATVIFVSSSADLSVSCLVLLYASGIALYAAWGIVITCDILKFYDEP